MSEPSFPPYHPDPGAPYGQSPYGPRAPMPSGFWSAGRIIAVIVVSFVLLSSFGFIAVGALTTIIGGVGKSDTADRTATVDGRVTSTKETPDCDTSGTSSGGSDVNCSNDCATIVAYEVRGRPYSLVDTDTKGGFDSVPPPCNFDPEGSLVKVHYDPSDPRNADLGDGSGFQVAFVVGLVFLLGGFAFAAGSIFGLLRICRRPRLS